MTKRIDILRTSLKKKEKLFNEKLAEHFYSVKKTNGQPLNDKKNGNATFARWERQNNTLRTLQKSIEKTKQAIKIETNKIERVDDANKNLPDAILKLITQGKVVQWRKYPNTFFVTGVKKARIVWKAKEQKVYARYTNKIVEKDEWSKFVKIFNALVKILNQADNGG